MFDAKQLFKNRLSGHMKELSRYLRYILTGHFMIAMVFILSAMSVFYQQWLENLPTDFPAAWVIALVLSFVTTYSPIQNFLKKADIVFLIPAEYNMGPYFFRTLLYSYVTQLYVFFLVGAALAPLYFAAYPERQTSSYGLLLLVLLVIKAWSLIANWWMLRIRERSMRMMDHLVRYFLIMVMLFFYIHQALLFTLLVTALFVVLILFNYQESRKSVALQWDILIERDYLRMRSFYRLANMFTDVGHIETEVKKRHWLARLLTRSIPFQQSHTFTYLYRLTTARSGEYLGLWLRLTVIGALAMYYVPNMWLKVIFAWLFLYMTWIQMVPLFNHHRLIVWVDLYPIRFHERKKAVKVWITQLIAVQTVLFVLLLLFSDSVQAGVLVAITSAVLLFGAGPIYLNQKLR
ncbi:ABC-type transport system permease [Gracilibacillus halophilus YIM-C55.5]|uniref:ABC-type transport system permease n=1 Tax=Gracilibacillus halophilus YIM-C55.5 TaxID=1308866 RepID=N4W725_9BACI|nr:ABC transporter permease [Gracilibacillus halophilus]ENH96028.1 ABC-type transport system permease [Gracilibacillus halophilus YIM-C55.5]